MLLLFCFVFFCFVFLFVCLFVCFYKASCLVRVRGSGWRRGGGVFANTTRYIDPYFTDQKLVFLWLPGLTPGVRGLDDSRTGWPGVILLNETACSFVLHSSPFSLVVNECQRGLDIASAECSQHFTAHVHSSVCTWLQ